MLRDGAMCVHEINFWQVLTYAYRGPYKFDLYSQSRQTDIYEGSIRRDYEVICAPFVALELFEHDSSCANVTQQYLFTPDADDNISRINGGCQMIRFRRTGTWLSLTVNKKSSPVALETRMYVNPTCGPDRWCSSTVEAWEGVVSANCSNNSDLVEIYNDVNPFQACQQASMTLNGTTYDFSFRMHVHKGDLGRIDTYINHTDSSDSHADMITMLAKDNHPYNDGYGCKSITCTNSTHALLQAFNPDCSEASPELLVDVQLSATSNSTSRFFTSDYPQYFDEQSPRYIECRSPPTPEERLLCHNDEQVHCTYSYSACMDIGFNHTSRQRTSGFTVTYGSDNWAQISPGCHKGLPYDMCAQCYTAGWHTYAAIVITVTLQVPLVWLALKRTSAASDSRCYKFWSLPLACVVIAIAVWANSQWRLDCFNQLAPFGEVVMEQLGYAPYSSASFEVQWSSYTLGLASLLAFLCAVINMMTPVPELYQYQWLDPQEIEMQANSQCKDTCTKQGELTKHARESMSMSAGNEGVDHCIATHQHQL